MTRPYGREPADVPTPVMREVAMVPYHAWGNRGPSTMRVWLPVAELSGKGPPGR